MAIAPYLAERLFSYYGCWKIDVKRATGAGRGSGTPLPAKSVRANTIVTVGSSGSNGRSASRTSCKRAKLDPAGCGRTFAAAHPLSPTTGRPSAPGLLTLLWPAADADFNQRGMG